MVEENTWRNKTRSERYQYLISIGASSKEARRGRDLGWKSINNYATTLKGPTRKVKGTTIKVKRVKAFKSKKERVEWWRQLSGYWNKGPHAKAKQYDKFNSWEKKTSVEWPEKAIQYNQLLWNELSETEKLMYPWTMAETHSAGYVIVYRHYVEGMSWEQAEEGIAIRPEDLDNEDWY